MARRLEPQVLIGMGAPGSPVLVIPDFLDAAACRRIRDAMDAGCAEQAEILDETIAADEDARRASHIEVDTGTLQFIEERLDAVRDPIAAYFGIPVVRREGAGILRYPPGGFFRRHRDWAEVRSWPDAARRRIALVVFLNGSRTGGREGCFSGGMLRFFPDEHAGETFDVQPIAGTLAAFHATTLHEVTQVEGGVRDAIVDWYY